MQKGRSAERVERTKRMKEETFRERALFCVGKISLTEDGEKNFEEQKYTIQPAGCGRG